MNYLLNILPMTQASTTTSRSETEVSNWRKSICGRQAFKGLDKYVPINAHIINFLN
jgi:hypothetical protein